MFNKVSSADFLEDPSTLELHLMGFHLADLVAYLSRQPEASQQLNGTTNNKPSLDDILGDRQEEVLHQGLRNLPTPLVKQLLKYPELLFDLQELALCYGDSYWYEIREQVKERSELKIPRCPGPLDPLEGVLFPAEDVVSRGEAERLVHAEKKRTEAAELQAAVYKKTLGRARTVGWLLAASLLVTVGLASAASFSAVSLNHQLSQLRDPKASLASRQHYSGWFDGPAGAGFSYRIYYFRTSPDDQTWAHHYVIHYDAIPKFLYYYNPYNKLFWGRYPTGAMAEPRYSKLADRDKKSAVSKIPPEAFPPPGPMPPIPGATDDILMDPPPPDLLGEQPIEVLPPYIKS